MKEKYEDRQKQKVIAITTDTLVVGVDIAKNYQWAKFVDFRGIEHDRALKTAKAALRLSQQRSGRYARKKILQKPLSGWSRQGITGKRLRTGLGNKMG